LSSADAPGKDVQIIYLSYPDLNQALLGKNVDAIMQTEPQASQAINKGFGVEVMKPYDTPIGEPVRTLVMTEKFYNEHRATAEKFMLCFVEATKTFIDNKVIAEKFVTQTLFKGQISKDDFDDAISNSPYSFDITSAHIQTTTDVMVKHGIGKMTTPPVATNWVKTDLLVQAKKTLNVK
jgi:NitT/TauT family transport system substrate-binding protein